MPLPKVREGLLAVQLQFPECDQPSKIKDLSKLASLDQKELRQRVSVAGDNFDKAIGQEIIDLFRSESILPEDVAKNGIIGVILSLFLITHFYFISTSLSLSTYV